VLLQLAQVIALAASCAPNVAAKDLAALARTESAFDPLALHDNTDHTSYHPTDKTEAVAIARRLLDKGHSVDIGMMQVNSVNFSWLALSLEDALDACPSLRAGAEVLTAYSRYNTGSPTRGFANGYVARVVSASQSLDQKGSEHHQPSAAPGMTADGRVHQVHVILGDVLPPPVRHQLYQLVPQEPSHD
jgi:type IV secretion system protein VirB1